ncbi:MFS transporter [Frigidibacter sp. MR17.14]|uniref:MFS transporter n=1 Tax=Frigidibacter sp. MR17.14 TaxID=3126509 RepID=UPI003012AA66
MAQPYFPLYTDELGASTALIGQMVTLKAALPLVIAMPLGQRIDAIGPMRMLQAGSLFLMATIGLTVFFAATPLQAMSQALMGAAIIIMASSFQVLVSEGAGPKRNEAITRCAMWMSGGSTIGRLIGGAIVWLARCSGHRIAFVSPAVFGRMGHSLGLGAAFLGVGAVLRAAMGGVAVYVRRRG